MHTRSMGFALALGFATWLPVSLTGCGDSSGGGGDNGELNDGPGTVIATIDGVPYASGGIAVDADLDIDDDFVDFSLRIDAEQEKNGFDEDLDLNLFGGDWSLIEEGDTFAGDGVDTDKGTLIFSGNYSKIGRNPGDDTDIQTATMPIAANRCTLTKIDRTNRLVSGTFSYDAIDITDDTSVFEVRDGVFTDVSY